MKMLLILFIFLPLTACLTNGKNDDYIIMNTDNKKISHFQYIQSDKYYYSEYFLSHKEKIADKEYFIKIRKYSWGRIDTSYYRVDTINFYHYNTKLSAESIILPRSPHINQVWIESDSSWVYKILKINQTFKTPVTDYKHCILVECKQLTGRDKDKNMIYYLYFSKGLGYVGDINVKGEIQSYLKEISQDN